MRQKSRVRAKASRFWTFYQKVGVQTLNWVHGQYVFGVCGMWGHWVPRTGSVKIWDFGIFFTGVCWQKTETGTNDFSTENDFFPKSSDGRLNWVLKCKQITELGVWGCWGVRTGRGQNGILAIFSTSVCVGKFWTLQTHISTKTLFYPISCDGHINWVLKSKKLHEPREESATSARWPASQKNQFLGNSLNPNIIHDPPRGQRNSTWNFWHGHTLETLNTHREHGFLQCWSWVANKCV